MERDHPQPIVTPRASVADELLIGAARALSSLAPATESLVDARAISRVSARAVQRGYFRPAEEEWLLDWFARFLTVRDALWEVLGEVSPPLEGKVSRILDTTGWRCFVLGYAAACLIVRLDQRLVEHEATHSLVQRKLNEGSVIHRIPRKQFTAVFESFTDPRKASLMDRAMSFARYNRELLRAMVDDPLVGAVAGELESWEQVLDPSRRRYGARLLAFISHSLRRRGASSRQRALFGVLAASGRVVSELHDHWTPPRLSEPLQTELGELLEPGDVLVTRHDRALTNLFLPGYWPHAALYVGRDEDRQRLGIAVDDQRRSRWSGDRSVLEALKDGVLFRSLDQTLAVDAAVVIRPRLEAAEVAEGISRVCLHEGKAYNFDFDFFRTDRLVCTEVVYRAFDGLGEVEIPLAERSGRPTLAAEDLLDLALARRGFEPVAVCGTAACPDRVVHGAAAAELIVRSYR